MIRIPMIVVVVLLAFAARAEAFSPGDRVSYVTGTTARTGTLLVQTPSLDLIARDPIPGTTQDDVAPGVVRPVATPTPTPTPTATPTATPSPSPTPTDTPTPAPTPTATPTSTPAPTSACTVVANSVVTAQTDVNAANPGDTVCLAAGSYAKIGLTADHTADVTLTAAPGAKATVAGLDVYGDHIVLRGLYFTAQVRWFPGADNDTADHDDMRGAWFLAGGVDCQSKNAPVYSGCTSQPPVVNLTLSGNRITFVKGQGDEDAIRVNHMDGLRVTGNEITNVIQGTGADPVNDHDDVLQAVWGVKNVLIDHNYTHDNNAQVWFIKDGDAQNVTISDNLDVRDHAANLGENALQIFNTAGLVLEHNTMVGGQGNILRHDSASSPASATVGDNVFDSFANGCCSEGTYTITDEGDNWISSPSGFTLTQTDHKGLPAFQDPGTDDYRAVGTAAGIDWRPADQHYGP